MEKNKIYNMDALEFLKGVESDSVDLIVTDPPYLMCSTGGGFFVCNDRTKLGGDFSSLSKLFSINIPKKEFDHPTIKPLDIVTTLIQNSSKEGELVLDCYMGSGTTAVAAKSVNRNFIGSEWNKKYCDIAEQRLMCVQGRLF